MQCIVYAVHVSPNPHFLGCLETPRIDEWSDGGPDTLDAVKEQLNSQIANPFNLFHQSPGLLSLSVGFFK